MLSLISTLAQASPPADAGDGSAVIGFLVIVGFLWAICAACSRKKTYDVSLTTRGSVRER